MATKKMTSAESPATPKKTKTVKISRSVSVFSRTLHKSQIWIREMQQNLKWLNGDSVYHLLRAVLQSLRDQMNVHEAAHFAAQLPLLLRGTFYEGWNPQQKQQSGHTKDDFIEAVKKRIEPNGIPKFELETGILVALNVIKKHISAGEISDVVNLVDPSLKIFIEKKLPQPEFTI